MVNKVIFQINRLLSISIGKMNVKFVYVATVKLLVRLGVILEVKNVLNNYKFNYRTTNVLIVVKKIGLYSKPMLK